MTTSISYLCPNPNPKVCPHFHLITTIIFYTINNVLKLCYNLVQILLILVIKLIKFTKISLLFSLSNSIKYYCLNDYYPILSTIIFQSSYICPNLQIISTLLSIFLAIFGTDQFCLFYINHFLDIFTRLSSNFIELNSDI